VAAPFVRDLAHALLDQLAPLADELVGRILSAEQPYTGTVPVEDLTRSVRDNLEQVIHAVAGDPGDPARLDPPRATGRRRAEQGLPLESLLHSYRIGGRLIWERMVGLARRQAPDRLDELLDGATQVWDAIDEFSTVVGEAYRTTERRLARMDAERQAAVVEALLRGDAAGPLSRQATELLGDFEALVVVVVERTGEALAIDRPDAALRPRGLRSLWQDGPPGRVGVIAGPFEDIEQRAAAALDECVSGRAGVSTPVRRLRDLPGAHDLARVALRTAGPAPDVAMLGSRLRQAVAAASGRLGELLVERTLGRIEGAGGEAADLVAALVAYLDAGGSAAEAAERLYCHRNTVLNRLRRVAELTGLDLHDPRAMATLVLALDAASGDRRLLDRHPDATRSSQDATGR